MATAAEVKQANLESAILFMQQEHANTLKGLHNEIHNLQKKTSELTFELAMWEGPSSEDGYKSRYETLEDTFLKLKKEQEETKSEVIQKDNHIKHLEQQLKVLERRYNENMTGQHKKLRTLTLELDNKADTIVNLSEQIRMLRLKVPMQRQGTKIEDGESRVLSPAPPKDGAPRGFRRHHVVNRPPSGRRLPKTPGTASIPDHLAFVDRDIENSSTMIVEVKPGLGPMPLPPIRQSSQPDAALNRAFVRARLSQHQQSSQNAEIVSLAVDNLPNSHQRRRGPAESESCEY